VTTPLFSLKGKVALVTGGNGGIGLGMARGLAKAGCDVVVAGRNIAKSKEAEQELKTLGVKTLSIAIDVADPASSLAAVAEVEKKLGRLDILINNAGINIRKQPEQFTPADWREVQAINLDGAFFCAQAAYPAMKRVGGGKIISIGSMMSIFGASFAPAYAASKGGIVQMTKSLAIAWAKDNIQVNAVLPGWIDTDLTRAARQQVDGLHDRVLARTPAARWGNPDDFNGIAVFLASSASDFVSGTAIPVDGGFSVQG
jgi:2-dehydro-3-deoxy-D-gluconate 5-dehydrogenase